MSYGLYVAQIIGAPADNDLRAQVRVLPQMNDISASMCPRWPFFFQNEALIGSTGDLVWVICNDDFSLGYILGKANYNTYIEDSDFSDHSIPADLKSSILASFGNIGLNKFSFTDLKVTFWNEDCIHVIEQSTGGVVYAYRNGTIFAFRKDELIISIAGGSIFRINASTIGMSAPDSINIASDSVGLGKNPERSVVVTGGSGDKTVSVSDFVRA